MRVCRQSCVCAMSLAIDLSSYRNKGGVMEESIEEDWFRASGHTANAWLSTGPFVQDYSIPILPTSPPVPCLLRQARQKHEEVFAPLPPHEVKE